MAASTADPGLGASSLFVVWRARVGASFFALFLSWLMLLAVGSKPQQGQSRLAHEIKKAATLSLIAWVGSSYLNFVCYPDELKYPESAWATA